MRFSHPDNPLAEASFWLGASATGASLLVPQFGPVVFKGLLDTVDIDLLVIPPLLRLEASIGSGIELRQDFITALHAVTCELRAAIITAVPPYENDETRYGFAYIDQEGVYHIGDPSDFCSIMADSDARDGPLVRRPWGSVGIIPATDLLAPEPARCLAQQGADIVVAIGCLDEPLSIENRIQLRSALLLLSQVHTGSSLESELPKTMFGLCSPMLVNSRPESLGRSPT
jgi:hypothetical protein